LLKAYDGWTNLSPNIEIESKYVRETRVLVYSLVFSAYVYTYVALHIRRCLRWYLLDAGAPADKLFAGGSRPGGFRIWHTCDPCPSPATP
jgi:hypothetical protein